MENKPFIHNKLLSSQTGSATEMELCSSVLINKKLEFMVDNYKWVVSVGGSESLDSPSIITLHDCGVNHHLSFNGFFSYPPLQPLINSFRIIHIDFPGHEDGSQSTYTLYPTVEQIAYAVSSIIKSEKLGVKNFFAFGAGFGANIFLRLGLMDIPNLLGFILINVTSSSTGIMEKISNILMSYTSNTISTDGLMKHLVGDMNRCNSEVYHFFCSWLNSSSIKPSNIASLMNSYNQRCAINFSSAEKESNQLEKGDLFPYPVLLIAGDYSPYLEETINILSQLNCKRTQFLKVSNATGAALDERPSVISNALFLFLQGHGYLIHQKIPTIKEEENVFVC